MPIDLAGIIGGIGQGVSQSYPTFLAQQEESRRESSRQAAEQRLKEMEISGQLARDKLQITSATAKDARDQIATLVKNWGADAGKDMQSAFDALIATGMPEDNAAGQLGAVVSHYDDAVSQIVDSTNRRLGGAYVDKQEARDAFFGALPTQFRDTAALAKQKALADREGATFTGRDPAGNEVTYQIRGGKNVPVTQGPTPSLVNIERQETAGEVAFATKAGEEAFKLLQAGDTAAAKLAQVSRVGQLLDAYEAAGGSTGALANLKLSLGNFLESAGHPEIAQKLNIAKDQTELGQALKGASNALIAGLIGTGPGALLPANTFSEQDRMLILSVVPQISDLGGGFRLKLLALQKINERAQAMSDRFQELRQDGTKAEAAYSQVLREFRNPKESLFTPQEIQAILNAPQGNAPQPTRDFSGFSIRPLNPSPAGPPAPAPSPFQISPAGPQQPLPLRGQ